MLITRSAQSGPSKRGPADWFTGTVWLDELLNGTEGSNLQMLRVTFEPGARTAWHTHPHGQTLHIVAGLGRVQKSGGPVVEVSPGDTVWFEPGERHWHGAAPRHQMVHLAVQQNDAQGVSTHWAEHVSAAEYEAIAP